jgi:hypothetical protein
MHTQVYINFTFRQALVAAVSIIVVLVLLFICARRCPCVVEVAPTPASRKPSQQQETRYIVKGVRWDGGLSVVTEYAARKGLINSQS